MPEIRSSVFAAFCRLEGGRPEVPSRANRKISFAFHVPLAIILATVFAGRLLVCHQAMRCDYMILRERDYPALVKEVRRQLALSQEDLARELGVSYTTINRWENGQSKPSKLAKVQLDAFCEKMTERGRLTLPEGERK
jgi:DNA-binding XRE family transcriptional regulator